MKAVLSEHARGEVHETSPSHLPTMGEATGHADNASGRTLKYQDFERFRRWYTVRRYRTTGQEPSPLTLRGKSIQLARCARELGIGEEEFLGTTLSDRSKVVFLLDRLAAQVSPGALRQTVYALRDFGDYAVAQTWIAEHQIQASDVPPKNPDRAITCYTPDEMVAFVAAARGRSRRFWMLLSFLAETGRRVGEGLGLEWDWFRLDEAQPYIILPDTKNRDPQYVPLTKHLVSEVFTADNIGLLKGEERRGRRRFTRDPQVYPFPWTYGVAKTHFDRLCEAAGLPNRGFHNFRHTVITERLARGVPLQAVAALAGHRSVATTDRRYNHTSSLHYARYLDPEYKDR